jgi:ubiquinone biosynthesis UbiH/UbiF/VisC/COQ6 family hydroxylase
MGLNVVLVEKQSQQQLANPANDGREIALTHLSRELMQAHGSWQRLNPEVISPLKSAHVIDGESPYTLNFDTPEQEVDALGFLISNYHIRKAIYEEVASRGDITVIDGVEVVQVETNDEQAQLQLNTGKTITAQLLIAADSRFSSTRQKMGLSADMHDFGRSAILCEMTHEQAHNHTALECFLYGGTLAVLPMNGNHCSVVITVESSQAKELLEMDEVAFNSEVEKRLGSRLGAMKQTGERHHYPLVGVHSNRFYSQRFALVGDAAVGMHPVTAHGFNLGLSGQDLLAKEIKAALDKGKDFWSEPVLARYQRQHMPNTRVLYHGTNHVVGIFTDDRLPAKLLRKAMLRISNHIPPFKLAIRNKFMSKSHPFSTLPPFGNR